MSPKVQIGSTPIVARRKEILRPGATASRRARTHTSFERNLCRAKTSQQKISTDHSNILSMSEVDIVIGYLHPFSHAMTSLNKDYIHPFPAPPSVLLPLQRELATTKGRMEVMPSAAADVIKYLCEPRGNF